MEQPPDIISILGKEPIDKYFNVIKEFHNKRYEIVSAILDKLKISYEIPMCKNTINKNGCYNISINFMDKNFSISWYAPMVNENNWFVEIRLRDIDCYVFTSPTHFEQELINIIQSNV